MSAADRRIGPAVLIALAVAALVALAVAWWNFTFVRVPHTVDLPPKGEASYNPLYALKLALRADGVRAESRQRLNLDTVPLGARDTVLILNDPRTLSQDEVSGLLDWVDGGGHLIVRTPPVDAGDSTPREGQLFDALYLSPLAEHSDCMRFAVPGLSRDAKKSGSDRVEVGPPYAFCGSARFTMDEIEPLLSWGDLDNGYVYARLEQGEGTVDVFADLDFLTNTELDHPANAALAREVLAPGYRTGLVHLVYAASMPPLWRLLIDRAWMAWLPLLLGFLAWLWMRTQRFGPLVPTPALDRRALLEHVQASGEHLWRYGRSALLHGAVRDAFFARLRRRDPLAAALDGPAQAAAIAARTGASAADVAAALQSPRPNDVRDFLQRISRLLQLRQQL